MKIGVLTFCKSDNAGTMLQLFALYKTLEKFSSDVEVIDYECPSSCTFQYPRLFKYYRLNKRYLFDLLKHKKFRKFRKIMKYSKIIKKGDFESLNEQKYDAIFVGSDQVLNAGINNYDFIFNNYLKIKTSYGFFGYGLSFGFYKPSTLIEKKILNDGLINFKKMSFREDDYLRKFKTNSKYPIVCDPTILLGESFWKQFNISTIQKNDEKYIFLYYATHEVFDEALKFAKANNYKIYCSTPLITIPKKYKVKMVDDDPINFINYISNAEYIFGSSYHCLLFSLFFEKPLYLPVNDTERFFRMKQLISRYGIEDITKKELIGSVKIDYKKLYKIMDGERKKSLEYIKECLNE